MPLSITVNPKSAYPIFLQIVEQVERAVSIGAMKEGEQMPTVRDLSAKLVVNPSTVARAWRELEHAGIIESVPGRGSFIRAGTGVSVARAHAGSAIASALNAAFQEARLLGLSREAVQEAMETALATWYPLERIEAHS